MGSEIRDLAREAAEKIHLRYCPSHRMLNGERYDACVKDSVVDTAIIRRVVEEPLRQQASNMAEELSTCSVIEERAEEAEARVKELEAGEANCMKHHPVLNEKAILLLRHLLHNGDWFSSCIELDTNDKSYIDGKELESRAREALGE